MTHSVIPAGLADEMIDIRHRIHAHPELGFEEFATSDLVAEQLQGWGYTVRRGGTGVVAQLKVGDGTQRLGLRADMDALPIHESTGLPYRSTIPGKMHACGHDGHTAMLLAAAKHLARERRFSGTLNLIFQPAEEGLGGAKKMLDDGCSSSSRAMRSSRCTTCRASRPASSASWPGRSWRRRTP
jgi:hippurate hydrolase